jgi:uncharacterized protein YciI
MHIIFLKFGPNRAQAGQWMAEHAQWIQRGIDDGAFLMAGSLDDAQGGVVLAVNMDLAEVQHRIEQDPFVVHGVVSAEVHAVAPSRVAHGMAALLGGAKAPAAGRRA